MAEDKGLAKSPRAEKEEKILHFWKENDIFKKTLEKDSPKGEFVFYEGPPTANGRPGIHHIEARAFKDAIPRYKTMQGFQVARRAGWDTHGLPVELEVEKQLGLKSKKEIEQYGVDRFNEECKKSVWKYVDEWRKFTDRVGYWVDQDNAYVTYHNSYIESVWSVLSHVEKRGLLYKDYKVLPWCPRCGTALSSHELAQGYADVKDLSVYAKFKLKDFPNAYFLAWTTTPWTLPGNVALAVGSDITYVEVRSKKQEVNEIYVLAKDRLEILEGEYEIVAEHKGKEMVGMEYESLYPFLKDNFTGEGLEKAYKIYTADFVTTTDGTGIVHTAVMYGQDDFVLGTEIGLPKYHLVDETGHFKAETGFLAGRFVKEEATDVEIIKDLAHRGLLFKKEKYEHSYPHCWRCKTPLIYYARDSWYIRMSELRDKLVKENEKINWEPSYIKEGRFGEWLREVKDWAISRERYWGTPLPIWESLSGKRIVVDSIETLKKYTKKSGNRYFVMRHGEAVFNAQHKYDTEGDPTNHLTELGEKQVRTAANKLKNSNIDLIFTSPFLRTCETAEIIRSELNLNADQVIVDERLHESKPDEGPAVRQRIGSFIFELEEKYKDKTILIISHGHPVWVLQQTVNGKDVEPFNSEEMIDVGNAEEMSVIPLPHNADFELDLHKPYIDEVVLEKDGEEYKRVKEVVDVWMDSGVMPFAQDPGNVRYPADFISEAIDQTRGWFYTLHAIGVLMEKGRAYKNVISLGHILDKDGKKMSKSVGNVVNPWETIDKYGVDTVRLWMYSVNQPGESKNFDERGLDEIQKKVFNLLDNVFSFYELYRDKKLERGEEKVAGMHVLDQWIFHRSNELINEVTENIDNYRLLEPVRSIRNFIDDLSTWYLRRSRDRIKEGDAEAKRMLYFVLKRLSKMIAPFAPFYAEDLYLKLRSDNEEESVHLTEWSHFTPVSSEGKEIMKKMEETRRLVSLALEARSKANIKVRQPLALLKIKNKELSQEYLGIVKDELNVKEVVQDESIEEEVWLDTTLTPELEEEGLMREEIRSIQEMRKEKGLKPGEKMRIEVPPGKEGLYQKFRNEIQNTTSVEF